MHASASADWKERERAIKGKEAEREGERESGVSFAREVEKKKPFFS